MNLVKKKKNSTLAAVAAAILTAAGLSVSVFLFPPSFLKVKEVVVLTPPKHLTEFDLIRLSQVKRGDNLVTLRLKKVRENILRFPWVREVRLSKRFPGRLLIEVEEHQPVAFLEWDGSYLVSDQGVIFKKSEPDLQGDLPRIIGFPGFSQDDLPRLISLIRFFGGSEILSGIGVSEVRRNEDKGISVLTREPAIRLELGEDRWEERAARFEEVWRTIRRTAQRPKVIDLNFEKRIVVKQES